MRYYINSDKYNLLALPLLKIQGDQDAALTCRSKITKSWDAGNWELSTHNSCKLPSVGLGAKFRVLIVQLKGKEFGIVPHPP